MSIHTLDEILIAPTTQFSDDDFLHFLHACHDGNLGVMRDFLNQRPNDINKTDDFYNAPAIHFAAKGSQLNAVNLLLENGAAVGIQNNDGFSDIHYAAKSVDCNILEMLLDENDSLVNQTSNTDLTPLMIAAEYGNFGNARFLLNSNSMVNKQEASSHKSALILAIEKNHSDIAFLLLDQDDINVSLRTSADNTALHYIADRTYDEEIARLILEKDPTLMNVSNAQGISPLATAIGSGNGEVATYLCSLDGITMDDIAFELLSQRDEEVFEAIKRTVRTSPASSCVRRCANEIIDASQGINNDNAVLHHQFH